MSPSSLWGPIAILALGLFAVPPIARRLGELDGDPTVRRIAFWGGLAKLAAAPVYLVVIEKVYGGVADALGNTNIAARLARQFRRGDFSLSLVHPFLGDGAIRLLAGIVYSFTGTDTLEGFVVFSFLAYLGTVAFYRGFRIAIPDGDRRRYAALVFLLPSCLFWTAATGKDALSVLCLGLAFYGGAKLLTGRLVGLVPLIGGLGVTALVRPNLALLGFVSLAVAFPFRRTAEGRPAPLAGTVLGVVVLVVVGLALARVTESFFHIPSLTPSAIEQVLRRNAQLTGVAAAGQHGFNSSVHASVSLDPLRFPLDFYDTVVRPLPFQASGITQLAQSFQNLFVLGLLAVSWRRIVALLGETFRRPYVLGALVYSVIWIVLFASIGNLGILSREETQLLPLLLVLACGPALAQDRATAGARDVPLTRPDAAALAGDVPVAGGAAASSPGRPERLAGPERPAAEPLPRLGSRRAEHTPA